MIRIDKTMPHDLRWGLAKAFIAYKEVNQQIFLQRPKPPDRNNEIEMPPIGRIGPCDT